MAISSSKDSSRDSTKDIIEDKSSSLAASIALRVAAGVTASLLAASALGADMTIQIGAFGTSPESRFTERARSHGEVLVTQGGDGITRVSIGRYQTKTDARAALSRLQTAGYPDAYIANVTSGDQTSLLQDSKPQDSGPRTSAAQAPTVAAQTAVQPIPQQSSTPQQRPTRTITNPSTASSQRLPSGGQLVAPKRPDTSGVASRTKEQAKEQAQENTVTQAGRFRLRTHDTQSGQTTDVRLQTDNTEPKIVPGKTFKEIPVELRNNLVYLDGVPHIKEGDQFIPLDDAVDGSP